MRDGSGEGPRVYLRRKYTMGGSEKRVDAQWIAKT